jgi:hypothetical protein
MHTSWEPCNLQPLATLLANQLKIFTDVGTAIIKDEIMNGIPADIDMPATNMWCAQTKKPRKPMATLEYAMVWYPNIGLREKTGNNLEIIPNPGKIMMYTARCE